MKPTTIAVVLLFVLSAVSLAQPADQWFRYYGGDGNQYVGMGTITPSGDGNVVILGNTLLDADRQYVVLMKLDFDGNRIWKREFRQISYPGSVRRLSDGGFVVVGYTQTTGRVYRLDHYGNLIWTYTHSASRRFLKAVTVTPDGNFLVAGDYNNGELYAFLELDQDGVLIWSEERPEENSRFIQNIETLPAGGFVVFGSYGDTTGTNYFISKFDSDYVETDLWRYSFGGAEFCREGKVLDDGFIIVGGADPDIGVAIKTDVEGNVVWEHEYTAGYRLNGVTASDDGGYVLCGYDVIGYQDFEGWVVKTSPSGEIEWEERGGSGANRVTTDSTGTIYAFGYEAFGNDDDMMLWALGRPEPEPAPQITIIPLGGYPIRIPAEGRDIRYYVDFKNFIDEPVNARIHQTAYTPAGNSFDLDPDVPFTLPPQSQQTFGELYQPVPAWAPPGRYAYIIQLMAADSDSVLAEDSIVFRKFEE